ncbi:MAG: ABC transporter ATP-binding protein/permease [Spirochaetaceae bacterium]|jgi:ATP-binding cassette subfamily B protein|nr:ABC transporter ATP-binding protein/permease [Spirochaetaceae bacterium]
MSRTERPRISLREFRTLKPFFFRYKWHYCFGFICLIIVDGAQVIIPQFMRRATDIVAAGDFEWRQILVLCAAMLGTMTLILLGRLLWRYCIHGSARRIEAQMRAKLFEHLLTLSYDFYQKNKIGDLMARATNDIGAVRQSISMGLVMFIDGSVMALSILIIVFAQDAQTAALTLIPLLPVVLLILFFGSSVGKKFLRAQESYSAMSEIVQETFAGIRVIKSFVKEWWFIKQFADTNDDYRQANMELVKLFGVFFPLISLLSGLTALIILLVGGIRVVYGVLSAGELVALFSYMQMLIWPLMGAGFVVNMIQRGAVSLGRVNEIMQTVPSITSPPSPERGKPETPAVELRALSFVYPDGTEALSNISLTIERGSIIGILGKTGCGKSTLIKVLTRLVDPPAGTVFIAGTDVRHWDISELHALFGVTPQDSYLFSDSIKNNIAYGLEKPDESLLKAVAAHAALDRDLADFTAGWDTVIGERGMSLSGGQKQRVAIARALITKPEILILDDSLSAVDAETEEQVLSALMAERAGKTTIIISHRVSTFRSADKIIVLEKGRIVESGTHQQLAAGTGFYARVAALQQLE